MRAEEKSSSKLAVAEAKLLDQKKDLAMIQVELEKHQQEMYNKQDELDFLQERIKYLKDCSNLANQGPTKDEVKANQKKPALKEKLAGNSELLSNNEIYYRLTKEMFLRTLKMKNHTGSIEHEDDLRLTFGTKASLTELYERGNMVKVNVSLFTKKITAIPKEISIVAGFNNTIKDILAQSCKFWKVPEEDYLMADDKYVALPGDLTISRIFMSSGGAQMIDLLFLYKHSMGFEILKPQEEMAHISTGNAQSGGGQGDQKLNRKVSVKKNTTQKLDDAPKKFFNLYPLAQEYMDVNNIDRTQKDDIVSKASPILHYQGPVVMYAIIVIIVIQLVQLFHFNIELIFECRESLNTLVTLRNPGGKSGLYAGDITNKKDISVWLNSTLLTLYNNTLINNKTYTVSNIVLIKYDTNVIPCGNVNTSITNLTCSSTTYSKDTRSTATLKDPTTNATYPWGVFKENKDLGVTYPMSGELSSYNDGGYMLVVGNSLTPYADIVNGSMKYIDSFITSNTLAVNFLYGGYINDIDYFFSVNLLFEKAITGGYQASLVELEVFKPTLSWNYAFNLVGDILIYILNIIQFGVNIKELVKLFKTSKAKLLDFVKKILFILTLIFFIIQVAYGIINTTSNVLYPGSNYLSSGGTPYVDIRNSSYNFKLSMQFKAYNTGIAILMFAVMLNHKITQKFTITILNETIIQNVEYLLLVIPVFIGMALVGFLVFGPYNPDFANFTSALISSMLFTIGRINPGDIIKYDSAMGFVFTLIFFTLSVFLSFTVFIGFGLQTYFMVMRTKGYYTPSWDNSNFQCKQFEPNSPSFAKVHLLLLAEQIL